MTRRGFSKVYTSTRKRIEMSKNKYVYLREKSLLSLLNSLDNTVLRMAGEFYIHEFRYRIYRFLYCTIEFRVKTKHVQFITSALVELWMNEEIPNTHVRTSIYMVMSVRNVSKELKVNTHNNYNVNRMELCHIFVFVIFTTSFDSSISDSDWNEKSYEF